MRRRLSLLVVAFCVVLAASSAVGASVESITIPDPVGMDGGGVSLALDSSGNPVVAYYDSNLGDLVILHCDDPRCSGSGESLNFPDQLGDTGLFPSLALDASDNPVVAYQDFTNGDLKVLHCNDPACAPGGDSIETPDSAGVTGFGASLELDALGNPVVSYYFETNGNLKLLHCNDPNCAGGDESIAGPDRDGDVGGLTDLELDPAGLPIIGYYELEFGHGRVMRCNDPNCAGRDEQIMAQGGVAPSLDVLDRGDGTYDLYVASSDIRNDTIFPMVLRCRSNNCDALKGVDTPMNGLETPYFLSLQMTDGEPVMAYVDLQTRKLRVASLLPHGDIPFYFLNHSRVIAPDLASTGLLFPSFQLDSEGNAAIAYVTDDGLKIMRCNDAACVPTCNGLPVDVDLGAGSKANGSDNVIRGTSGDDTIDGRKGNDVICGLGGDDTLVGGDGFDKIFGGAGNDTLVGDLGNDRLVGGPGNDMLQGGNGNDRLIGGPGNDDLRADRGNDRLSGGDGTDSLSGGDGSDLLFGNLGRDQLDGGPGNDTLKGGAWIDSVDGGPGDDDRCGIVAGEVRVNCERGIFGV